MSRSWFSQTIQEFGKIVGGFPHMRSDSKPEVDTGGICVENCNGRNWEFFIWIRFDFWKTWLPRVSALLREDLLIFKLCPLEERASLHAEKIVRRSTSSKPPTWLPLEWLMCTKRSRKSNVSWWVRAFPWNCDILVSDDERLWNIGSAKCQSCDATLHQASLTCVYKCQMS